MSTLGDILGRGARPNLGTGFSIPPEQQVQLEPVLYSEFHAGIDLSETPEDVREGAAVYAIDMELTRADYLVRSPGVAVLYDEDPRALLYMFEHSSIDYSTELVVIDPPYLGFKGSGAFTWIDLSLAATGLFGWNAINYLGFLLFSNGVDATYSRDAGAAVVTDESANIIARTMAVAFGRKFAGYYDDAGNPQSLGIRWDDTTATVGGWSEVAGAGGGREYLLSNSGEADYIVALRPVGFDLLAVLNRKTLWAGYQTKVANHPAEFRHRFSGVGCVAEPTAVSGPGFCTFLSDDGVVNYNGNSANIISGEINPELIPLDYSQISKYRAAYQAFGRRYYLNTPDGQWIYEYAIPELQRPARWFRRSLSVDALVAFTDQAALTTWDDLSGSWDSQAQAWNNFGQSGSSTAAPIYMGKDTRLGKEDPTIFTAFGSALQPRWRTPQSKKINTSDVIITHGFEILYSSDAESTIAIKTTDTNEAFNNSITRTLPSTGGEIRRRTLWGLGSGVGVQCQIEITSGSPRIGRIQQLVERAGPTMTGTIV